MSTLISTAWCSKSIAPSMGRVICLPPTATDISPDTLAVRALLAASAAPATSAAVEILDAVFAPLPHAPSARTSTTPATSERRMNGSPVGTRIPRSIGPRVPVLDGPDANGPPRRAAHSVVLRAVCGGALRDLLEVHAAHAAHVATRHRGRGFLLGLVGDDGLGGEEQGRDRGCV